MVYLLNMVIFHGYVSHNQRVVDIIGGRWHREGHQPVEGDPSHREADDSDAWWFSNKARLIWIWEGSDLYVIWWEINNYYT